MVSWLDRVQEWADKITLNYFVVYLLVGVLVALLVSLYLSLTGLAESRNISRLALSAAIWICLPLTVAHLVDKLTSEALTSFAPALDVSEQELADLRNQLTSLPAVPLLAVCSLTFTLTLVANLIFPEILDAYILGRAGRFPLLLMASAAFFFVGGLIYHSTRLLRQIGDVYQTASSVTVLHPDRAYAFSSVSAVVSLSWAVLIYATIALVPELMGNLIYLVITGGLVVTILSSVISLLMRINRMLRLQKAVIRQHVVDQLQDVYEQIQERYGRSDLEDVASLRQVALSMKEQLDFIDGLPTWPWQPGTLAAVVSALLLPAIVVLIQEVTKVIIR